MQYKKGRMGECINFTFLTWTARLRILPLGSQIQSGMRLQSMGSRNGLEEVLKKLKEVGKQLVVATSKPEVFAREIIRYFHLDSYFSYVAGMELDGGRGTKAEVIEYAIRSCGAEDRREVLMIGDRKHDVIGARQAGIDCVGVLYGFGSEEELKEAGAAGIAASVEDILKYA